MYTNEILEEVWATKKKLWEEADGDINKFFDQLEEFSKNYHHPGPRLRTEEEVRNFLDFGILPETPAVREDGEEYRDRNK